MANLHKFDLQTLPAMAWKNGGGVTREIVREPAGSRACSHLALHQIKIQASRSMAL